ENGLANLHTGSVLGEMLTQAQNELLRRNGNALGLDDERSILLATRSEAKREKLAKTRDELFFRPIFFPEQDRIRLRRKSGAHRQNPAVPSHDLHDERATVGTRRVRDPITSFDDRVYGGVRTDGKPAMPDVIVDGRGDPHDGRVASAGSQPMRARQGS